LVDTPPTGYARVDAFFTAKNDVLYALLPRWPTNQISFEGLRSGPEARITLLESGDELRSQSEGNRLQVEVPDALRSKVPHRDVYVLKMAGVGAS
jgi:alpha-L-fucosidase